MDCLFCKIINGDIPSTKVFENESVVAFLDISPQAPVHIVVIPKQHIKSIAEINSSNSDVIAKIGEAIADIAKAQNLANGFRVITNVGENGGQTVNHIHFHILGGKKLTGEMV